MVHRQDKAIGAGQHRKGTGLHQGGQVWMAAPQPAGMGPVGWQDDSDGVNQKTRGAAAGQAGFGGVMARDFKGCRSGNMAKGDTGDMRFGTLQGVGHCV